MNAPADVLAVAEKMPELIPGTAEAVASLNADLAGLPAPEIAAELDRRVWGRDDLVYFLRCSPVISCWHERELAEALRTGDH